MPLPNPTATSAATGAAALTIQITLPAVIAAGTPIYLFTGEQTTGPVITWPAGFVDLNLTNAGRTNLQLTGAVKQTADGTEGGTNVVITSSASKQKTAIAIAWPTTGVAVSSGSNGASSLNVVSPSVAVATPDSGALAVSLQQSAGNPTWTPPGGYTEATHIANNLASSTALAVFYLADTLATNPTGTLTAVSTLANNWSSGTVVLPPFVAPVVTAAPTTSTATPAGTVIRNHPLITREAEGSGALAYHMALTTHGDKATRGSSRINVPTVRVASTGHGDQQERLARQDLELDLLGVL